MHGSWLGVLGDEPLECSDLRESVRLSLRQGKGGRNDVNRERLEEKGHFLFLQDIFFSSSCCLVRYTACILFSPAFGPTQPVCRHVPWPGFRACGG